MNKAAVKGFHSILPNPLTVLVVVLLAAIICVLSSASGAASSESHGRMTLLSATPSPAQAAGKPASKEGKRGGAEQPGEWRAVKMRVTAYCPCEKCCGEYSDGITACGHRIRPGDMFAAADKRYAFETEMKIPGYNNSEPVEVLDRGGAIRGDRLDVFFHSHEEALNWGVKYLLVQVRQNSGRT
ncbi:MAG: 3D domain-containing protein [Planctomycetota bacterium]